MPIPEPLRFIEPRETETRTMHAPEEYGVMQVKLYEDIARFGHIATTYAYPVKVNGRYVMDPSPIPKFDNPKMHMMPALQLFGAGRESGSTPCRPIPRWRVSISTTIPLPCRSGMSPAPSAARATATSTKWYWMTAASGCLSAPIPTIAASRARGRKMNQPLLAVNNLTHLYAPDKGFRNVSFELWPGEVLGIVGESGSGKTTLLKAISARLTPQQGEVRTSSARCTP